jgi:2-polyprenyl-6-hydroxyphenyl methylase/3-demethylubiquinone-9 3-methyltransferase
MNQASPAISGYRYENAASSHAHRYLLPTILKILRGINWQTKDYRIFELGCGNGATADFLVREGFSLTGVDPSEEGIAHARMTYPRIRIEPGSCYDDLAGRYGRFPVVLSLEVVEHVFVPRELARRVFELLEDNGTAIISTPFHGYWRNLALALTGKLDRHFTVLWDYGHIEFWSEKTLRVLLEQAGFTDIRFERVGRIRPLAKSMIAVARRPARALPGQP